MEEYLKEQREEMILSFVQDKDYRPLRTKEMANLFSVPKKERGEFHDILDELIRKGKIEIDRRGFIRLPENRIFAGTFMATRKGFGFVRIEGEENDIFIPEPLCSNAFHGDLVQIRLIRQGDGSGRRSEGEVIRIMERKTQTIVGTFTRNKNVCFVIPDNEKITHDIYIAKGNTLDAADGHKVVVELSDYGNENKNPEGHVVQILGHINDPGVDILSIVKSFGLPEEFPEQVMRQVAEVPDHVESPEFSGRMDIRGVDTVTIDGEDAKDLDDAITISKNEDGSYELGVHIADVSHYVTENSPLDKEALRRGTSVYLVDHNNSPLGLD